VSLDKWIPELRRKTEQKKKQPNYKLPLGSVSVYFREGEGFTMRYDERPYRKFDGIKDNIRMDDLMTNLSILSKIWNKLIQLNLSPKYLSKAYDDDLFATVIDVVNNREEEAEIEIDGFKVVVSKHKIGTQLIDMARYSPIIPYNVIQEMSERGIYFENPMLQYQLAKELKTSQKTIKETKTYRCELCGKPTTELHELRAGANPRVFPR